MIPPMPGQYRRDAFGDVWRIASTWGDDITLHDVRDGGRQTFHVDDVASWPLCDRSGADVATVTSAGGGEAVVL